MNTVNIHTDTKSVAFAALLHTITPEIFFRFNKKYLLEMRTNAILKFNSLTKI